MRFIGVERQLFSTKNESAPCPALKDSFRQSDILARLGGDEFAILVADAAENDIGAVLQRIELSSFNADPERRYDLSFSIGIVPSDATQDSDLEQLLCQADALMYRQKQRKKDSRAK